MKFQFKVQQYQTDAVESVVKVFNGYMPASDYRYTRDLGKKKSVIGINGEEIHTATKTQLVNNDDEFADIYENSGYLNGEIRLTDEQLLKNIHEL